ncbi:glycosyl hydrolase family 28-related protein [Planococcus liqunii]|uniref:Glycosyl hydrolase family 28-related protein n=1 Tax=Planococcus liqunii TaxID=3058394 RepID=A0ABT8MNL2_9BACL|nr:MULTISPECIES: glycosyl hydrolase family 28-related protein [unclassified Planococcus (in: firmicutes)]MDN7226360.1 glycosyl hydrolase family 28-related protein [Planococcus sp. N064]WKA50134.1 glycosyl hydrolase family 28-related protein [Planococcus sp. N056]
MAFGNKKEKQALVTANRLRKMADEVTFSERPDKTFNVKAFGAKGDDDADDWRALQQAIAFAYNAKGGGTLFFPPGQYRISKPLEVPVTDEEKAVSWVGYSDKTTIIVPSAPMDYMVRMRGGDGHIKGLTFKGSDPFNGSVQHAKVCMLASNIRNKTFSNVSFSWAKVHGLQITEEGNNNLCVFDQACKFEQNGTVVKGSDGSGSGDKISFSSFNPESNDVHVGAYIKIGSGTGSVYHINSVSRNSVSVSPALKNTFRAGTDYQIHIGSGLQTDRGSDNNVYGIYDCHFVGNAGAGLVVRGLYGHNVQGGNFDANGIAGIHIGSGMINTTPAYSNVITHAYFEANGYANVILDYPSGLSIIEPLLAEPIDGTAGGIASITSLRDQPFDYETTSVLHNGRLYHFINETTRNFASNTVETSRITVNQARSLLGPSIVNLPAPPKHRFKEELEIYVENSGGQPVQVICDYAKVNNKPGRVGVEAPAGVGYKISAYYSRSMDSWMVSHTTPMI